MHMYYIEIAFQRMYYIITMCMEFICVIYAGATKLNFNTYVL